MVSSNSNYNTPLDLNMGVRTKELDILTELSRRTTQSDNKVLLSIPFSPLFIHQ